MKKYDTALPDVLHMPQLYKYSLLHLLYKSAHRHNFFDKKQNHLETHPDIFFHRYCLMPLSYYSKRHAASPVAKSQHPLTVLPDKNDSFLLPDRAYAVERLSVLAYLAQKRHLDISLHKLLQKKDKSICLFLRRTTKAKDSEVLPNTLQLLF